jgi:hypothetical protein
MISEFEASSLPLTERGLPRRAIAAGWRLKARARGVKSGRKSLRLGACTV